MKALRIGLFTFVSLFLVSAAFADLCDNMPGLWYGKLNDGRYYCTWDVTFNINKSPYDSSIFVLQTNIKSDNSLCRRDDNVLLWGHCENGIFQINSNNWGMPSGNVRQDGKLDLTAKDISFTLHKATGVW